MARHIHYSVIRGEIDNRLKGIVRGKLWLDGMPEPVALELEGNACEDLAGCLLKFTNPGTTTPVRQEALLAAVQRGRAGDLTASRKLRVSGIPSAETGPTIERGEQPPEQPPEQMANGLYLEWFSESNGRVVIESTEFNLEISPPEWRLTAQDEQRRQADATAAWRDFLAQLDDAVEKHQRRAKDPDAEWDEHDYERLMKESDARTDKYMELIEKYGDSEEADEKIAEEMGWIREMTDEEAEEERLHIEEINAACESALDEPPPEPDPHREGIDWIRDDDGEIRHPLQHRCCEAAIRVWRQCEKLGLHDLKDDDLARFLFEFRTVSVKLGGALNCIAKGWNSPDPAFTVACLKRALDHLHKAQAGLEAVASGRRAPEAGPLLPESLTAEARRELFEIREGILRLMQEFRGR